MRHTMNRERSNMLRISVIFPCIYISSILAFNFIDFRNTGFYETGPNLVVYNILRLLHLLFLILITRGAGCLARRVIEKKFSARLTNDALERLTLDLIAGAAVMTVVAFPLVILGFLMPAVVLILTVPLVVLGAYETLFGYSALGRPSFFTWIVGAPLFGVVLILCLFLFLTIGLSGAADEYDSSHYLPYYEQVALSGSAALNMYWYHYWITNGAVLQFIAVSLGDVFSASIASFMMLMITAMLVFTFVRRSIPTSIFLPLAAVVVFLLPFISTYRYQNKEHFVTMALITGCVWVTAWLCKPSSSSRAAGLAVLSLLGSALVISSVPLAALACVFFFGLAVTFLLGVRPISPAVFLLAGLPLCTTVLVACIILAYNFFSVGMAEATPFKIFFDHADQFVLAQHVSPYLILFIEEATTETTGRLLLDQLWPLNLGLLFEQTRFGAFPFPRQELLFLACAGFVTLLGANTRERLGWPLFMLVLMLFSAAFVALLVSQPGSLNRLYVFAVPVNVILLACCASALASQTGKWMTGASAIISIVATFLALWLGVPHQLSKDNLVRIEDRLRFAVGQASLARDTGTLTTCDRLSAESADDAPRRVWTLNFILPVGCFVMPNVQILMEVSANFGPNWHRIVFGDRDTAKRELADLGIEEFLMNTADFDIKNPLSLSSSIFGCLAYSDLFDNKTMALDFSVVWREEDTFLLRLGAPRNEVETLPEHALGRWSSKKGTDQPGLGQIQELCKRVEGYYNVQGENWPVAANRSLPRLKGWQ